MFASSGLDSASRALPDEAGAYVIAARVYQQGVGVTNGSGSLSLPSPWPPRPRIYSAGGERSRDSRGDRGPAQGLRRRFDRGARARRRHSGVPERRVRGDHGPERLREEHPAAHPGRPGQADRRARRRRRHGALGPLGQGADAPQARADGVRIPILQPHTDALGGGERAPAGPDLRQEAGQVREAPRRAARPGRPHGPPLPPPGRALGRRAAAGRHSPRPHTLPRHHPRRRADRQPRLQDRRRGARPAQGVRGPLRADHTYGHPRPPRRLRRRPRHLSLGRPRRGRGPRPEPGRHPRTHQGAGVFRLEMAPRYRFRQLDDADAREISGWRYEPPYDFYDATADPDDLAELLDPERRRGVYFSVLDGEDNLIGFFQFEKKDGTVDVGLGLRPSLTGKGLGAGFVMAGLAFARERFSPERFTLSVAAFNGRAIGVYGQAGFRRGEVYLHETNGGEHEFLRMEREA